MEQARLAARIAGLQAQRDALLQALGPVADHGGEGDGPRNLSALPKGDAIVAVLRSAGRPLTISDIVRALHEGGRPGENYNGISVYLQDLLSRDRVHRPSRGLYVAV